jgi:hypothetical protein
VIKIHLCSVIKVCASTHSQTATRLLLILLVQLIDIKVNRVDINGSRPTNTIARDSSGIRI